MRTSSAHSSHPLLIARSSTILLSTKSNHLCRASLSVGHVIVGHSERRHIVHGDDSLVKKKGKAALRHGLVPILCVGEDRRERGSGRAVEVVLQQLDFDLADVKRIEIARIVIAYEPIWAIGMGPGARPGDAELMHRSIRNTIFEKCGAKVASSVRIVYGGSVNAKNIGSLVAQSDIGGALVGGASLNATSFSSIVNEALAS